MAPSWPLSSRHCMSLSVTILITMSLEGKVRGRRARAREAQAAQEGAKMRLLQLLRLLRLPHTRWRNVLATGSNGRARWAKGHSAHGRLEARDNAVQRVVALFQIKEADSVVLAARHETLALGVV